jgi:hypothetical protein
MKATSWSSRLEVGRENDSLRNDDVLFPLYVKLLHHVYIQVIDLLSTSAAKAKREFEHVYEAQNTSEI